MAKYHTSNPNRGSKKGEKRGGRTKGTVNVLTRDTRALFKKILDNLTPDAERWIREAAEGVVVEKQHADGSTVKLRMGADPRGAADLLLKLAEFYVPKLQRLTIDLTQMPIEDIAAELVRREAMESANATAADGTGLIQ